MENLQPNDVLKFLEYVNDLKRLPRRGWTVRGIKNCETISGHMYAMAMMTFLLGDNSKLDRQKCMELALVHDLAEAIVGDITPFDNIDENLKHKREKEAMREITSHIGPAGRRIYELYDEYALKESDEAKFVKDLDRFDFLFTGASYEKRHKIIDNPNNVFETFAGNYNDESIQRLATAVIESRSRYGK